MDSSAQWDRSADVWEQRLALTGSRPDPYSTVALDALALTDEMRILDVGCGPGVGSVQLAERAGPDARVIGIDISPAMITKARHRVRAAIMRGHITPENIELRVADAERDDLGTGYDIVFSRFGVMFFDIPQAAFTNIAGALRAGGRLSFTAWAAADRNPWMIVPFTAAAESLGITDSMADLETLPPFSLGNRAATVALLEAAGFTDIGVIEITQPRRYPGATVRQEMNLALYGGPTGDAYRQATATERTRALDAVMAAIERYREPSPTGAWIIPAHARAYLARKP